MACFGFVTFLPERPLFSVPFFISRISVSTCLPAAGLYLRPEELFFAEVFFAEDFFAGAFFAVAFFAPAFFVAFLAAYLVAFFFAMLAPPRMSCP